LGAEKNNAPSDAAKGRFIQKKGKGRPGQKKRAALKKAHLEPKNARKKERNKVNSGALYVPAQKKRPPTSKRKRNKSMRADWGGGRTAGNSLGGKLPIKT